jgi:hypothetical protein
LPNKNKHAKIKNVSDLKLPPPSKHGLGDPAPIRPSRINKPGAPNGTIVKRRSPATYAKVIAMLTSAQYNLTDIAKATGIHVDTIRGIYRAQRIPIDEQRAILTSKIGATLRNLIERVDQKASTMKPRDAIFGVSVLSNQWNLLTGAATSHNLNVNVAATPVDLAGQFAALSAQIRQASSEPKIVIGKNVDSADSPARVEALPAPGQDDPAADAQPRP